MARVGAWWALLVLSALSGAGSVNVRFKGKAHRYVIASFPMLRQVNYAMLPNPVWRPLIASGLHKPEAVSVDADNQRLFVADAVAKTVVAYRFQILSNGRLMTDGHQRVVLQEVIPRGLFVDVRGTLYVAGRHEPPPPAMPLEGIFKQDAHSISSAFVSGVTPQPRVLWTRANTAPASAPSSPRLFEPSCLTGDALTLFWANRVRPEGVSGAVVSADAEVPELQPEDSLRPLADNVDEVTALALTPNFAFYAGAGQVYGTPRQKAYETCGDGGVMCPSVIFQDGQELNPTAMMWDGDGTVYMADHRLGAIFSFASGSLSRHLLTKVADASGVWGLAHFVPTSGSALSVHSLSRVTVAVLGVVMATLSVGLSAPC